MFIGAGHRNIESGQAVYIPAGVFYQITNISEKPAVMLYIYGQAGDVTH